MSFSKKSCKTERTPVSPCQTSYNEQIEELFKLKQHDKAWQVFAEMGNSDAKPTVLTYQLLFKNVRPSRDSVLAELDSDVVPPLWLWERRGEPVSLAGHAPPVSTPAGMVGRVGPVYTPVQHRGRGYGSAITHAVSATLRPQCSIVMLYTDAANATSNAVYERLGYTAVADVVEIQLAPGPGAGQS